jgi:hypothetical protein
MVMEGDRRLRFGLVLGEHGDEAKWPFELVAQPPQGVDTIVACPKNVERGIRFQDRNIAQCYPGDPDSDIYEERCAYKVVQWARAGRFDAIFNIHTNRIPCSDYLQVGPTAHELLFTLGSLLQFRQVIIGDINGCDIMPNVAVLDYSPGSIHGSALELRRALQELAVEYYDCNPRPRLDRMRFYEYGDAITKAEADELGLPPTYPPFHYVPELCLPEAKGRSHVMLWGDGNPEPFRGEVIYANHPSQPLHPMLGY